MSVITLKTEIERTPRVMQLEGMFDLSPYATRNAIGRNV